MIHKSLTSFDGTRIEYQVGGTGDHWLVVANGYGGSFWAWAEIFDQLGCHFRLLLWDYRGLHSSGTPTDLKSLRIEDNCRDLDLLMEAEGIEEMIMAGWSVGVQVALEQYRRRPDTIRALMLINGAHGRVLHRSADGRLAGHVLPPGIRTLRRLIPLLSPTLLPALRVLARTPRTVQVLSRLGLIQTTSPSIQEALQGVLTLDWGIYLWMALLADQHDTDDLLPNVGVPTLVTAGDRDIITPPRMGKYIAARIPGAEYFEIPGGTHYAVMEYPGLVADRMDRFVRSHLDYPTSVG